MSASAFAHRIGAALAGRLGTPPRHGDASKNGTTADAGFALVEVLVGMIILAIVGAATVLAVVGGINTSGATQSRVSSTNLAQQAIASAEAVPAATLAASPTSTTTATVGSTRYTVTRSISYAPTSGVSPSPTACPTGIVSGTPYSMIVHVSVSGGGQFARPVTMDTVIAC